MIPDFIGNAVLYIVPLLFAVILHEVAHGWVAEKLGDPTARMMGRITLNPISHIDPFGTILLPLVLRIIDSPFLFGWAKPVPVHFVNLRGGRKDMALVALSGPLTNFALAALSSGIYHLTFASILGNGSFSNYWSMWMNEPIRAMAYISVNLNLILMVVNLFPILPLDGGRILAGLAPLPFALAFERTERFGILILLLLIGSGAWRYILNPVIFFLQQFLLQR